MRLFLAIKIPEEIRYEISHLPPSIKGVKRVPDTNRHITILFLGEKNESEYHRIIEVLHDISFKQFDLKINNTGIFKQRSKVTILWAGIQQSEELHHLYQQLKYQLNNNISLAFDKKKFTPHITLGRAKSNVKDKDLIPFLSSGLFNIPNFKVKSFSLYSSILQPEGAVYTEEVTFNLEPLDE